MTSTSGIPVETFSANLAICDLGLGELSRTRCEELLALFTFGRVVVGQSADRVTRPVGYRIDRRSKAALIKTSVGTKLNTSLHANSAILQIEGIDTEQGVGWNVEMTGALEQVIDLDEVLQLVAPQAEPWLARGELALFRILATTTIGRAHALAP